MDIVEPVGDPRRIVQVLHRRLAIVAAQGIDHVHGGTGGAVVDTGAREEKVVLRITAKKRDIAARDGQHILDQRPRKPDASVIAQNSARAGQDLDTRGRCIGKTDLFQCPERGLVNPQHLRVGQRLERAAGHPRADRTFGIGKGRCTGRSAGGAAAGTGRARRAGGVRRGLVGHDGPVGRKGKGKAEQALRGGPVPPARAAHRWCAGSV